MVYVCVYVCVCMYVCVCVCVPGVAVVVGFLNCLGSSSPCFEVRWWQFFFIIGQVVTVTKSNNAMATGKGGNDDSVDNADFDGASW